MPSRGLYGGLAPVNVLPVETMTSWPPKVIAEASENSWTRYQRLLDDAAGKNTPSPEGYAALVARRQARLAEHAVALADDLNRAEVETLATTGIGKLHEKRFGTPAPTDPGDVAPLDWALREYATEWKRRRMADLQQTDPEVEDLSEDQDASFFSGPALSEAEDAHRRSLMAGMHMREMG